MSDKPKVNPRVIANDHLPPKMIRPTPQPKPAPAKTGGDGKK